MLVFDMPVAYTIAKLRASGQPGDYLLHENACEEDGDEGLILYVNVAGMAHTTRLIGYKFEDAVIPTVMTSYDATNALLNLSWCDGAFVHNKRVPLKQCLPSNPRLLCHPVGLPIHTHGDQFYIKQCNQATPMLFDSPRDLAEYYHQHSLRIRSWQHDGAVIQQRLVRNLESSKLACPCLLASKLRTSEAAFCLDLDATTADSLLTQHWCQPGDFLIRAMTAAEREQVPHACYVLSMMLVIRLHHHYILLDEQGMLYLNNDSNHTKYATLCDLIDYLIIHERCERIPYRRIICPAPDKLAKARADSSRLASPDLQVEIQSPLPSNDGTAKRNRTASTTHANQLQSASLDGVVKSLFEQALLSETGGDSTADSEDADPYANDVRDLTYFTHMESALRSSDEESEGRMASSYTLGTGGETVPNVKRNPTGRAERLTSLYAPFDFQNSNSQAGNVTQPPSNGSSRLATQASDQYRDTRSAPASTDSFLSQVATEAKRPHQRSFSWAALAGSYGQSEIDDVFG
eukprot:TRINITY_DN7418_c0_g1_i1.p1 TRINITY_DN7418_c0_g1~~TRINITY_DN7418_c0_g1_i1.p1  ORF type:complete len:519 (+),score=98.90 TRINITY_DN7418_c0_g1_i1:193-1749(+)